MHTLESIKEEKNKDFSLLLPEVIYKIRVRCWF